MDEDLTSPARRLDGIDMVQKFGRTNGGSMVVGERELAISEPRL